MVTRPTYAFLPLFSSLRHLCPSQLESTRTHPVSLPTPVLFSILPTPTIFSPLFQTCFQHPYFTNRHSLELFFFFSSFYFFFSYFFNTDFILFSTHRVQASQKMFNICFFLVLNLGQVIGHAHHDLNNIDILMPSVAPKVGGIFF